MPQQTRVLKDKKVWFCTLSECDFHHKEWRYRRPADKRHDAQRLLWKVFTFPSWSLFTVLWQYKGTSQFIPSIREKGFPQTNPHIFIHIGGWDSTGLTLIWETLTHTQPSPSPQIFWIYFVQQLTYLVQLPRPSGLHWTINDWDSTTRWVNTPFTDCELAFRI